VFSPVQVVEACSPLARIVVTGSGLVTLLNAIRTARVNGFALWDAVSFLPLGSEPAGAAALDMAARILLPFSRSWPEGALSTITPAAVVGALEVGRDGGLTSPRPALQAYMISRMGDAQAGSAEKVLSLAYAAVRVKLQAESTRDTVAGLVSLDMRERQVLRAIAEGRYTWGELMDVAEGRREFKEGAVGVLSELLAQLAICLSETPGASSDVVRLQPPYACLLLAWITPDGQLAVAVAGDKMDLAYDVRKHLVAIAELRKAVTGHATAREDTSRAVLACLAANRIGVLEPGGNVRPPRTASEFDAIPALAGLKGVLSAKYKEQRDREPSLHRTVHEAVGRGLAATAATPRGPAGGVVDSSSGAPADAFPSGVAIGWEILLALRHFEAHNWADPAHLVRNGLTAQVVADVVNAAVRALTSPGGPLFLDAGGRLQARPGALPAA
jgi:hypothetical protein